MSALEYNSEIKTSLNGVVVTPNTQKTNFADNAYPLEYLLSDRMISKFRKNELPSVVGDSKDGVFIQPKKHVITSMEDTYLKWLFIGTDFIPSHDHNYPVVKVKSTGYIMRISIDRRTTGSISDSEFMIDYIQDITKIETLTIKNVTMSKPVMNIYKDLDMMIIRPYQVGVDDDLIKKIIPDKKKFFDTYVKDVFDE